MNDMDSYIPSTFDNTSLSQLREDAKLIGRQGRRGQWQFEALFVNMLLKSMRKQPRDLSYLILRLRKVLNRCLIRRSRTKFLMQMVSVWRIQSKDNCFL